MAQAGVFQSVKPDAETPQWVKDYESEVDVAIAALKKNWNLYFLLKILNRNDIDLQNIIRHSLIL